MNPRYYTVLPIEDQVLMLMESYDAIGFKKESEFRQESVKLRGGVVDPGDVILKIVNSTKTAAGFTGLYPIDWKAKYLGLVTIMVNGEPCDHMCFDALRMDGSLIEIKEDGFVRTVIAFAVLDEDLHFTTRGFSSRLLVCDEIVKESK